jgi:hypothetical protein
MTRFSLAPPPRGNGELKAIDIVGVPDLEKIKEFVEGNLGISDSLFDDFIQKNSAGLSGETAEIFNKTSKKTNNLKGGLKGLEITTVKSILETQKPYIDVAIKTIESLTVVEDIIAVLLAGQEFQSLKPKTNEKSLYTKLNGIKDDLKKIKKETQPSYSSYKDIPENQRKDGISLDKLGEIFSNKPRQVTEGDDQNYDWATISAYYSTGDFVPGVPYNYTYINIIDTEQKGNIDDFNIPELEIDDNPPVIIFDIWSDRLNNGQDIQRILNPNLLPTGIDLGDKWQGVWDTWSDDKIKFIQEYTEFITELLQDEFDKNNISEENKEEIQEIVLNAMPFDSQDVDFYDEVKKSSFHKRIYDELKRSNDSYSARQFAKTINDINGFGYKPRKINGKWIYPETDYNLQLIKIVPNNNAVNSQLSGNKPLVFNYDGETLDQLLNKTDYNQTNYTYTGNDKIEDFLKIRYRKNKTGENVGSIDARYGTTPNTYFRDKGSFYIIEGVYKNRKDVTQSSSSTVSGAGNDERWYRYGAGNVRKGLSIAAATAKFAKFGATFLPDIINTATSALKTLNNPFNLIFEIVMEKIGDGFEAFGPEFTEKFQQLQSIKDKEEKRRFISEDNLLKNYISMDRDFNYKFVFDGAGVLALFGFNFGIGINNFSPKLILDANSLPSLGCDEKPPDRGADLSGNFNGQRPNADRVGGNPDGINNNSGTNNAIPQTNININDNTTFEVVNIEYSTGDFVEGVNYNYFYITLDNQSLTNRALSNIKAAEKIPDKAEAVRLKLEAMEDLQKALVKDPGNLFLNNQINELQKSDGVQVNMMIQFILSLVTLPIKIVICIIDYILDFFKSIILINLPKKIPELLSFDWILQFFKPTKVLELMGMKINPDFVPLWNTKSKIVSPNYKFDASQILDAPFLGKLPLYSALQFPELVKGGSKIGLNMGGLFKFLELLVNNILCFLFNVFNIDKIFVCPSISLSRFLDSSLTEEDRQKLLSEADFNFTNNNPNNKFNKSQLNQNVFVYEVRLDDGTIIKDLNYDELQAYIASNRNLKYKYNFNNG